MSERLNYEYRVRLGSNSAAARVISMVGHGKRVLDVGCGPGSITKMLATYGHCKVVGLEIDPIAIERARPFCEDLIQLNLNERNWPESLRDTAKFEVIVAADVLEHLYDPWTTLQQMVPLLKPDGYLVISLPHFGYAPLLSCIMLGNFAYQDAGLLDRTHIRFFCLKNMEELLQQAGLKIIETYFVRESLEKSEFANNWSKLPAKIKSLLASSHQADIYQVVLKAVPVDSPGVALSLGGDESVWNDIEQLANLEQSLSGHVLRFIKQCLSKITHCFQKR